MNKVLKTLFLWGMCLGLSQAVDICEYQMDGVRLAHPADCGKFVVCDGGKTDSIMNCPLGLHFNRFKGMCDLRQRAFCDIEFIKVASEEEDCSACCALYGCLVNPSCPSTPETPAPETPTTPEPATECPPTAETPATPETSETPATECPETPETPETPVTECPPTPETPDTPKPPAPETPNNNCPNNITVCKNIPDGTVATVNGTCNQFIVCAGGCANIMNCPNNLQYNVATHICDYPENVECPWPSSPSITGPSGVSCAQPGICAGERDGTLYANPNSNGYIVCQCECEIERPCPVGTKFDEDLKTCAHAGESGGNGSGSGNGNGGESGNGSGNGNGTGTGNGTESGNGNGNGTENGNGSGNGSDNGNETIPNVVCPNNIQLCKNETEGALFPVDGVCNKFYKCNYGCAIEILCPNNLVYNPTHEYCDYPQNYKCPWPYTPPSGPTAGPSGIACPSGGRCVGQDEGTLFPSLNSCSKYVICQCECEVEMSCPKDLLWDSKLSTCNYAANVTCTLATK